MNQHIYIADPGTHKDIVPAIEETQQEILAELQESASKNSLNFGTKRVTLQGDGVGAGPDQPCRTCLVSHTNTTTYMGSANEGTPDASSFLMPTDIVIEVPVRNLNKLSFFGTAGEHIHLLWRN